MNKLLELRNGNATQGAPVSPISTRHTVCNLWRDQVEISVYDERFACYENRIGGLSCPTDLGHRKIGGN